MIAGLFILQLLLIVQAALVYGVWVDERRPEWWIFYLGFTLLIFGQLAPFPMIYAVAIAAGYMGMSVYLHWRHPTGWSCHA